MRSARLVRIAAPFLAGSLLLAACGSESEDGEGDGSASGSGGDKVAKIGVIAPLSGDLSALGLGIKNSVDLAIKQANEEGAVEGWTFELAAEDDQAKPDEGARVATKLAGDEAVIGVVGTLNSSVAQSVQPILDSANVLMVSPANTNPTLTQGDDPANKKRAYKSYFRTATTDSIQGPFAARYLFEDVGAKNVAIIHDNKTYGKGLTDAFKGEFEKLGGKIVGTETITPGDKDFSAVISKVKPLNPAVVYYGGEYPEASLLSNQMKGAGLNVPLMGGDGIYDGTYIENGKQAVEGDLATSVGAPTEQLDSAKDFVAAYEEAGYSEPFSAYGAYAYDAAQVIIEAAKKALEGEDEITEDVKKSLVEATNDVSFSGVTGEVAFDEYGDTTSKVLTVYKVTGGKWVPAKTDEFE